MRTAASVPNARRNVIEGHEVLLERVIPGLHGAGIQLRHHVLHSAAKVPFEPVVLLQDGLSKLLIVAVHDSPR